jgi:CubicO group peptidase (beta-lactamase class C family)
MNSKIKKYIAIPFILTLLVFAGCDKDVPQYDTDAEILNIMENYGLPSVAAGIIHDGSLVWTGFYGTINLVEHSKPNLATSYNMASISKLFIVTAVMQLEERGLINLDTDINEYIPVSIRNPNFPDEPITVRMFLTHTSGLTWPSNSWEVPGLCDQYEPDQGPRPSEWVPQFLVPGGEFYNQRIWKKTKPGKFEYYSNIGSNVLAYLVEIVSGEEFREYCQTHIFIPLGMVSTSYNYADLDEENLAVIYYDNNTERYPFDDRLAAAGGLKSSIRDLGVFMTAILNGGSYNNVQILKESTISKALEVQNEISGRCLIWDSMVGGWNGHTGGMDGAATSAYLHSESKTVLMVFTNKHNNTVYPGHEIYGLVKQKANEFVF